MDVMLLKYLALIVTVITGIYLYDVHSIGLFAHWCRYENYFQDYTYTEFKRFVALVWFVCLCAGALTGYLHYFNTIKL